MCVSHDLKKLYTKLLKIFMKLQWYNFHNLFYEMYSLKKKNNYLGCFAWPNHTENVNQFKFKVIINLLKPLFWGIPQCGV